MRRLLFSIFSLLMVFAAFAQTRVTGTVYDAENEPVIGASVVEKGKTMGVSTDIDGNFAINVDSPNATLVISYIGTKPQEIELKGRNHIEVTLHDDSNLLDEVVIVGYGVQKKINATGSVKTIDNEILESRPVTNAVQSLQGAVAGLNITNDNGGELGQSMNINIRGVGSIGDGSNSSPLILIDGMEGDLSTVNPNDIANISVLKDAAAASIYGSRAPFGVILVTTKTGEKATRVSYTGNVRIQQPVKVPHVVDSYTYALMTNEAAVPEGLSGHFSQYIINNIKAYMNGEIDYYTEPQEGNNEWKRLLNTWGNTNWYDEYLKKNTTSTEHNISVTGGGDKVTYYFSGGYLYQSGLFKYADESLNRFNFSARINVKFNDIVSMTYISRFVNQVKNKPSVLDNTFFHNLGRRHPNEGMWLPNGTPSERSMLEAVRHGGRQSNKTQQLYNQVNFTINPLADWNIHVDLSSRIENNPSTRQFKPIYVIQPDGTADPIQVIEGVASNKNVPAAGESYFAKNMWHEDYFQTNVYTDYEFTLADKHHFKVLVGEQTEWYKYDQTNVASKNIQIDDTPFLPSVVGDKSTYVADNKAEWSTLGIFGRLNYNFDDKYMFEANLRGDAASRFPSNQRWGVFPSFSLGWNIAQESFWRPLAEKGFSYLKIRGSYGKLGNQNTTSFYPYYQSMVASGGSVILGGQQATVLPVFAPFSTNLTWETIENYGGGIDWGFFNNRFTGAFDYYERNTKDMVGPSQDLPAIFGGAAPKTNNAELRTRGWELEFAWRDRINKDFSYGISASISDYNSKVTKYQSPNNALTGWYEGKEYGEIWGYKFVGIAQSDDEMAAYLKEHSQSSISTPGVGVMVGANWGAGDIMYEDINGDGSVDAGSATLDDPGDLVKIGNTTPHYAFSFTLEANWKFIDMRAFFQGIGKRDIAFRPDNPVFFGFANEWNAMLLKEHLDYYRMADSELGANFDPYYGRLRYYANNRMTCDHFLQSGAYLRLKNLQIGFSLPESSSLRKYVQKARLYVSGENLFTWTKLKIYDPEAIGNTDVSYIGKTYPQYRTWSVGLELTF